MNVEDQVDFCISISDAEELLDACNAVLNNHELAPELLPTMEGFLFGNTEYNEYYFDDIKDVRDFCENILIPELDNLGTFEDVYFHIWY